MTPTTAANPLLQIQFQIPFDQIRAENVEPAIEELLQEDAPGTKPPDLGTQSANFRQYHCRGWTI